MRLMLATVVSHVGDSSPSPELDMFLDTSQLDYAS